MKVENLSENAGDFTGNIWKLENGETVLIDVGTGDSWNRLKELDSVEKVILTHSHYDHVDNLWKVVEEFSPKLYANESENLEVKVTELNEGDKINLSGLKFEVFHTPGHKNDSICLYSSEKGLLFTGDLIFPEGGFARTDLEEGDRDLLIGSIQKLVDLDVEAFYPGHNDSVTEDAGEWIERSLNEAEKRESKY